jgi:ABC-type multidrug transport system permease subunit
VQSFSKDIKMYLKEYADSLYRTDTLYLAKSLVETPFMIGFPVLFCVLVYYIVGLNAEFQSFLIFTGVITLVSNAAFSLGYVVSTLAPSTDIALALAPVSVLPFLLLGGLFINSDSVPAYFKPISAVSFFTYGYEILGVNEFDGETIGCHAGEDCNFASGREVLNSFSMEPSDVQFDVFMLFVILVSFRAVSYLFLYRRAKGHRRG